MKRKYLRNIALSVSCAAIGIISFTTFSSISNATYYGWKWTNISFDGKVVIRANDDHLNSSYNGATFTGGLNLWSNSGADVHMEDADYSTSNVDMYSVSSSQWTLNGWGNGTAWTQPYRSDGTVCVGYPTSDIDLKCGTGTTVNYAAVYTNDGNIITSSKRQAVVAHEIGHAMGLAHTAFISEEANSLMTSALAGGLVPSAYDVSQLNSRY
ncbi:hypothetical protein GC102_31045 [Paenibacillus sp. LMG 31460]|uniref:Matrixin n=1 Tax=Paenibacillus germinis TaxID=2654979 RepID=A0ABX1Z9W5_9BACL|nr:zinc-dependent metalloprotease family protein [Paenibacillus germinis]NOU90150.1 hypothetical protein [Paenibacillus germinis]